MDWNGSGRPKNIYGIPYPPDVVNQTNFNGYSPTQAPVCWRLSQKKRSRKDTKFETHNIYGIPYPPDIINQTNSNEYSSTQEETLLIKYTWSTVSWA